MFFAKKKSTNLNFVTVGVTKFVLTKLGIIIDVIEPVSVMISNELPPNLAAIRMQRIPQRLLRTI